MRGSPRDPIPQGRQRSGGAAVARGLAGGPVQHLPRRALCAGRSAQPRAPRRRRTSRPTRRSKRAELSELDMATSSAPPQALFVVGPRAQRRGGYEQLKAGAKARRRAESPLSTAAIGKRSTRSLSTDMGGFEKPMPL